MDDGTAEPADSTRATGLHAAAATKADKREVERNGIPLRPQTSPPGYGHESGHHLVTSNDASQNIAWLVVERMGTTG